jgi:hypothetical protein
MRQCRLGRNSDVQMMIKLYLYFAVFCVAFLFSSSSVVAQEETNTSLPREFHGVWVTDADRRCPDLRRDEDANGVGEGALLLRETKFYSHESLCRITGQVKKSCCDAKNEQTIAANYSCGKYGGRVILHLRRSGGEVMLVESYENAALAPSHFAFALDFSRSTMPRSSF